MPHKSIRGTAGSELMFVSGYVYRVLSAKSRELGIRWSALMVLVDLNLLGPTQQRTLVAIEQVSGATMTVLLQELEARGWIERVVDATDARVARVTITAAGRAELKRAGTLLRTHLNAHLSGVPDGVLKRVAAALAPLSAALIKTSHVHEPPR
jgi:DNA-binding MarR family transcriptional regulator